MTSTQMELVNLLDRSGMTAGQCDRWLIDRFGHCKWESLSAEQLQDAIEALRDRQLPQFLIDELQKEVESDT